MTRRSANKRRQDAAAMVLAVLAVAFGVGAVVASSVVASSVAAFTVLKTVGGI